jgi:hypothetical protein
MMDAARFAARAFCRARSLASGSEADALNFVLLIADASRPAAVV